MVLTATIDRYRGDPNGERMSRRLVSRCEPRAEQGASRPSAAATPIIAPGAFSQSWPVPWWQMSKGDRDGGSS
jgi:hypothetical protein